MCLYRLLTHYHHYPDFSAKSFSIWCTNLLMIVIMFFLFLLVLFASIGLKVWSGLVLNEMSHTVKYKFIYLVCGDIPWIRFDVDGDEWQVRMLSYITHRSKEITPSWLSLSLLLYHDHDIIIIWASSSTLLGHQFISIRLKFGRMERTGWRNQL